VLAGRGWMKDERSQDMTCKRTAKAIALWLAAMGADARAAEHTILPGSNLEVFHFSNQQGWLRIWSSGPVTLRWIHEGEKREVNFKEGEIQINIPRKMEGRLEAGNSGSTSVTLSVDRKDADNANIARTWENFWGSVGGGRESELNKAHREVKRWVKKCFGVC
jgi:hypothetical protein